MKKFIKNHIPFLIMSFILLLMIAFLIVMGVLQRNTAISEAWTRGFGRQYTKAMSYFNRNFLFSVTEVSFFVVALSCVFFLGWGFSFLGNKKVWPFVHRAMMVTLIIVGAVTMYNASVGFAYTREALPVEGYKGEIKKEDFRAIAEYFVQDYNQCANELGIEEKGELKMPYSQEDMIAKVRLEFNKLHDDYFSDNLAHPKPLETSGLFNTVGIVGMYFGVLGEVNYNTYSTNAELPFYIAHELCHSIGVMREDDAQFLSFYLLSTSDDPLLRYSAYYNTIDRIIAIASYTDNPNDYSEVKGMISDVIKTNYRYIYEHWKGRMFLYDLGNTFNDWYLKTFSQSKGTISYNDTPTEVDPGGYVVTLSNYQSIYFKIYYDNQI